MEDLDSYNEIATLYRCFKTALDRTKDYADAGLFYFNELEMKRKHFRSLFKWRNKFKKWGIKSNYILYTLYKIFMGYGARPSWSFLWLIFFFLLFPFINLFNGLNNINYDLACSIKGFPGIFKDWWCTGLPYTFSRFLPKTYLPSQWENLESTGYGFVPFLTSVILILLLVFTGIGLKRHFRRF